MPCGGRNVSVSVVKSAGQALGSRECTVATFFFTLSQATATKKNQVFMHDLLDGGA